MGGNAGESNRSTIGSPTTTTSTTSTSTTTIGDVGLTGQDAVDLASVLGESATNADTLVQNLNTTNDAANVQNNANLLNASSQAYDGLLNATGQNYTQLISGANNLLQAEQNFGQQEAQSGRDALTLAANLGNGSNQSPINFQDLPSPTPLAPTSTGIAGGVSLAGTSPWLILAIGAAVLFFIFKE